MSQQDTYRSDFTFDLERNKRKKISFGEICRAFAFGEKCEFCEQSSKLYKKADACANKAEANEIQELARQYYARSRIFINAIDCKDAEQGYPVKIFALPPSVYDDIISLMRSMNSIGEKVDFLHPETGRNIVITRKGQKPQIRYTVNLDSKPSPIPNKAVREGLIRGDRSLLHNLNDMARILQTYEVPVYTIDQDLTILRIMPPFDGVMIYKELKFHRIWSPNTRSFDETSFTQDQQSLPPQIETSPSQVLSQGSTIQQESPFKVDDFNVDLDKLLGDANF